MPPDTVTIRTLRNDVAAVIKRVEFGESLDVTRHGERVARLVPLQAANQPRTLGDLREAARGWKADREYIQEIRDRRDADVPRDPYE